MRTLLLTIILSFCAGAAYAQETRGTFSGTVTDSTGAAIAGATVTITNVDTNTSVTATTNSTGYYEAPLLIAGNYQISVQASGFRKLVRSGLTFLTYLHQPN